MKLRYACFVYALLTAFTVTLFAGTTGKIVGVVTDKRTGEALIGVNIIVEGTTLGATTDLDGSYLILNVPPGTYTLSFQYIGYQEVRISNVKVSVDFTTQISTDMSEATVDLGETIEVVAEREIVQRDLTSSQSEVSAEDIAALPTEEFEDVLQLQAGITRSEGGGFHIRGGRSSEVAFWVDGVSVTDGFDGSLAVEIENDAVQSLQVISGTFNAEYGQAMSGIINIVTKEGGQDYTGSISAYAGDYITNDDDLYIGLDDVGAGLYDYKASLSGPVPGTNGKVTFFANGRYNFDEGHLYGRREVNYDGSPGDSAIVPLNDNTWMSLQSKLTWSITNLMKLRVGFNWEDREFREYDHFYKFNPDGDFTKYQTGFNGSLTLDHTLGKTTFYTLKYSRFQKDFEQYVFDRPFSDPSNPQFGSPYLDNDERFVLIDSLKQFVTSANQFSQGGQKTQHFNRTTTTDVFKFDMTSQVSKEHQLKFGLEAKRHELDFLDFGVQHFGDFTNQAGVWDSVYVPFTPDQSTVGPNSAWTEYTVNPLELSFYLQDKMEYDDFIVNVGLRFDWFDSDGQKPADPMDPSIDSPTLPANEALSLEERQATWYEDVEAKFQVSPRVGIAYPITEKGVIHVSYGHFLQIPEFRLLYENPRYRLDGSNTGSLMGNPDLDAQKTVMYEIGLQQAVTEDIGFDVTGFYRDVRSWVGSSPLQPTHSVTTFYSEYENRDYANVRGITLSLNKRFSNNYSANLSYTAQVAEGNASDPRDAYNDIQNNNEPRKVLLPLDWDRTHVLNGNVYYNWRGFGISLLGRFESGLPYTPQIIQGTRRGANIQQGLQENSERRPNLITFDMQASKDFSLKVGDRNTRISVFAKVFNLFDRRNEQIVFGDTGRATYTLESTVRGASADPRWIIRPDFFTQPRRVQIGISYDF